MAWPNNHIAALLAIMCVYLCLVVCDHRGVGTDTGGYVLDVDGCKHQFNVKLTHKGVELCRHKPPDWHTGRLYVYNICMHRFYVPGGCACYDRSQHAFKASFDADTLGFFTVSAHRLIDDRHPVGPGTRYTAVAPRGVADLYEYILNEGTQHPVMRAIGVSHTACKDESFDETFDLTAGWSVFLYALYYTGGCVICIH